MNAWQQMTRADAEAIGGWHYPAPYNFYDADADPEDLRELLDADHWPPHSHFSWREPSGALAGFATFDVSGNRVMVGLGLRPDLTGHGLGQSFVQHVLALARREFPRAVLGLAVAAFNIRAQRVYERTGFRIIREFFQETNGGSHPFVEMAYQAED